MRNRHHNHKAEPAPAAVITALCGGPRTVNELALELHCRPSCLGNALHILRQLKLITTLAKTSAGSGPAARGKIDLAIDPIVGMVLMRARLDPQKNIPKNPLRGSLDLSYVQGVRKVGTTSSSSCVPIRSPAVSTDPEPKTQ